MNMCRKFWQRSKTAVCAALFTICLISPQLITQASAAEVDVIGDIEVTAFSQYWNETYKVFERGEETTFPFTSPDQLFEMPRQGEFTDPVGVWDWRSITPTTFTFGLSSFVVNKPADSEGFYGNCALYLNWYIRLYDNSSYGEFRTFNTPVYFTVYDASGKIVDTGEVYCSFYDVAEVKGQKVTNGVACRIKFNVPEAIPAIRVELHGEGLGKVGWFPHDRSTSYPHDAPIELYVPSATLIASVKSAEVEALEDVTNAIIEQNGLTQEKFTEVIGKVDEVYKEIGTTNNLLEESMKQFDDWNDVSSVPPAVSDKVNQGAAVLDQIDDLVKPEPDQIIPDLIPDYGNTDDYKSAITPVFENTIILQLCTMVLGFAFVSFVLFGKKG